MIPSAGTPATTIHSTTPSSSLQESTASMPSVTGVNQSAGCNGSKLFNFKATPKQARSRESPVQNSKASVMEKEEDGRDEGGESGRVVCLSLEVSELMYPEGGLRAYGTVCGGFLAMFASFGFSNAWGSLQSFYQSNQLSDMEPGDIAWIGSVALCVLFLIGFPNGFAFDAGYFRYQLAIGSILNIVGMFTLSVSKTYWQIFLSYLLAVGIGGGIVFGPLVSCIGTYFLRRRGIMIGLASCGAATGAIAFPTMLNLLFPKIGYASGVRAAAYLQTGCFVLANMLMQPRSLPIRKRPPILPLLWAFCHEPETWLICGGCALTLIGMFIPLFYFQVFVEDHDGPPWLINYGLAIMNSTAVLARLVIGVTCDKYGKVNNAVPIAMAMGVLIYVLMAATNVAGAVVFALLYGGVYGAWITVQAPTIMSLSKNVTEIGTRMGLGFVFLGFAVLIGSPVAGALLVKAGGYWGPCVFGGTSSLLGGVSLLVGRQVMAKKAGTWRV